MNSSSRHVRAFRSEATLCVSALQSMAFRWAETGIEQGSLHLLCVAVLPWRCPWALPYDVWTILQDDWIGAKRAYKRLCKACPLIRCFWSTCSNSWSPSCSSHSKTSSTRHVFVLFSFRPSLLLLFHAPQRLAPLWNSAEKPTLIHGAILKRYPWSAVYWWSAGTCFHG